MKIVGHGIDVVEICRIEELLRSPTRDWAARIFSVAERNQADAPPLDARYYAGRFAAKEAVGKALGTGFTGAVTVHSIEILRRPTGAPMVKIGEDVQQVADSFGITDWLVSISYSAGLAVASVIAVAN